MLVFSSELRMRSNGSSRSPCQEPSYRSSTTAALVKKSAARGKIQCSYCQGLMASSSRRRQTVLRLMGLFSSSCARLARSVVDWRLNGFPVLATTSQAMDARIARSRGGKGRLAATSRVILEGPLPPGPALPPQPDGVGVQVDPSSSFHVGQCGCFMQEQDQTGALAEVRGGGAGLHLAPSLCQELSGEERAIARQGSRHQTTPKASGLFVLRGDPASIAGSRRPATLQLFARWTT